MKFSNVKKKKKIIFAMGCGPLYLTHSCYVQLRLCFIRIFFSRNSMSSFVPLSFPKFNQSHVNLPKSRLHLHTHTQARACVCISEVHNFPNIWEAPQSSRGQKGDTRDPGNILCQGTKLNHPGDLAFGIQAQVIQGYGGKS